ncbi:unnamed protein product [Diabrotica balteata]|uniref:Sema domain-containing protein n=1 Tax=Diabrotica balteata TaxID=107213 RepID=A0A9N9XGM9_DIABA|nr:unnamed protein product [Diabrotica balteata]
MAKTSTGKLLLCGTNAFKPICREYNILTKNYTSAKEKPGQAVCPYDPHHNSTAIYVADTQTTIQNIQQSPHTIQNYRIEDIPPDICQQRQFYRVINDNDLIPDLDNKNLPNPKGSFRTCSLNVDLEIQKCLYLSVNIKRVGSRSNAGTCCLNVDLEIQKCLYLSVNIKRVGSRSNAGTCCLNVDLEIQKCLYLSVNIKRVGSRSNAGTCCLNVDLEIQKCLYLSVNIKRVGSRSNADVNSDHNPLVADVKVKFKRIELRKQQPKINVRMLKNEEIKNKLKNNVNKYAKNTN